MEIRFIGTGAHDYSPLLDTVYKNQLDTNARRSSSALIDEHLLIDCGDHTIESLQIQGISLDDINVLLLTHLHEDHYCPENIKRIANAAKRKLKVYACKAAIRKLKTDLDGANVEIHGLTYCKNKKMQSGMVVTAVPANHTCYPCHYLLEHEGKRIYYGTDGAWIMYDTFRFLLDKKLDVMILDATVGDYEGDFRVAEHNSIPMIRLMMKTFYNMGFCHENTRVILSHIAPSLHKAHDETSEELQKDNFDLAYDGLVISV